MDRNPKWFELVYRQIRIIPSIDKIWFQLFRQQCKYLRRNSKKIFHGRNFDHPFKKRNRLSSLSSQKIRTPGVFKTLYSISLRLTSKTNMHRRSFVTFCRNNLSIEDIKGLKYLTVCQKHFVETGKTYITK